MLVTVGAALASVGHVLPLLGPRIDSFLAFLRLGPLFRLVGSRNNGRNRHNVLLSWRSLGDVELRLTSRTTAIRDGLKDVSVHFDEAVRERAYRQALALGSTTGEAEAIGDAAMVAVAALSGTGDRAGGWIRRSWTVSPSTPSSDSPAGTRGPRPTSRAWTPASRP